MDANTKVKLGDRVREIRARAGWTLAETSAKTGLATSTLSKVERNQISLTYDNLVKLAYGLGIEIATLFAGDVASSVTGRRSITRGGEGQLIATPNYDYQFLSTELSRRLMVPIFVRVKAGSVEEFGDLMKHEGEEFIYVLDGAIKVYTEFYEPVVLNAGDSIYLDSTMGHGYLCADPRRDAVVLGVCAGQNANLSEPLDFLTADSGGVSGFHGEKRSLEAAADRSPE